MIKCTTCNKPFPTTAAEDALIALGAQKKLRNVAVWCPHCDSMYSPLGIKDDPSREAPVLFKCPVPACWGEVVYDTIEGEPFWGCGECGKQWPDKVALDSAIDAIVARYRHRAKAYRRTSEGWAPAPAEPANWEDLVASERISKELGVPAPLRRPAKKSASPGRPPRKSRTSRAKRRA